MTNRVGDYCAFAVRFVGLGYIVLWPLAVSDPFGLARFCRRDGSLWQVFCHWPHLLSFTPGLHLIGVFCAGALGIHLALRRLTCWRQTRLSRASAVAAPNARVAAALARAAQPPLFRAPLPTVKPRSHFGLRQAPRRPRESGVSSNATPPKQAATEPRGGL